MKPLSALIMLALCVSACGGEAPPTKSEAPPPPPAATAPAVGVYATNEQSGDMSVIDAATRSVVATIPLGKRPRGIAVSPDRKKLYVALSGSPAAPRGVDE